MIAFRRFSNCPTLPDLIRDDAEARAARWMRTTPIAVWCRPSTLLRLQQHNLLPAASTNFTLPVFSFPSDRMRHDCQAVTVSALLAAASLVLSVGGLLLRGGLITPLGSATFIQWSSWLTGRGMRLWRKQRSRSRR
jgi:hypothetical protein